MDCDVPARRGVAEGFIVGVCVGGRVSTIVAVCVPGLQLLTHIPYSAPLRPVMVLLLSKPMQRTLYDIALATYMSRQVMLLGAALFLAAVVVSMSLVANNITSDIEQLATTQGVGFGSFPSAILTMFNFVFTGENFGTVVFTYSTSGLSQLVFIVINFAGNLVVLSLLVAAFQVWRCPR